MSRHRASIGKKAKSGSQNRSGGGKEKEKRKTEKDKGVLHFWEGRQFRCRVEEKGKDWKLVC